MLNLNVDKLRNYFSRDESVVLSEKNLADQLGEKNLNWISQQNILKQLQKEEVNNLNLELPYGEDGEREDVIVYYQSDKYVFEPTAEHLSIMQSSLLPERIFQVSSLDFAKVIALANDYSHVQASLPIHDGFYFVGNRKFGQKEVTLLLFTGNPQLDFKRIEEQVKIAQIIAPSNSYVVLVFAKESLPDVPSKLNFSMCEMRSNLLVSPRVYKERGISLQDVVGVIRYPVLIDYEREFIFILGKRVTKQKGTTLYKYLKDFIVHTQSSEIAYADFCSEYCKDKNGEASRIIGERKKEATEALEKVLEKDSAEYQFAYSGLFSFRSGFLKSHFIKDDVFEWPK